MIQKESWYKETTEKSLRELERAAEEGNLGALYQLGREYLRTKQIPKLSSNAWATFMPALEGMDSDSEEGEWAWVFLWAAAKVTETLPNVDSIDYLWAVPEEVKPRVRYSKSWEVMTEGSVSEGDMADTGMFNSEGEMISYRNFDREGKPPWETHNFIQEAALDDFVEMLKEGPYSIEGGDWWTRSLDREDAQNEFGDTYGEDLGPPSDYDGTPSNEVVGGGFSIHLENFKEYLDRIDGWVRR